MNVINTQRKLKMSGLIERIYTNFKLLALLKSLIYSTPHFTGIM